MTVKLTSIENFAGSASGQITLQAADDFGRKIDDNQPRLHV